MSTDPFNLGSESGVARINHRGDETAMLADGDYEHDSGDSINGFDTSCHGSNGNRDDN